MPLPKKITPDSIVDAVVEIKYFSQWPPEVLIGVFCEAFDQSYIYTNRPVKAPRPGSQASPFSGIMVNLSGQSLLYNDKISINLQPGAVVFNCLDKYIGWEEYKPEIEKALHVFVKSGHIAKWTRAGLRYITEYVNVDLKAATNFDFTFGFPEVKSISTAFRTEFDYNGDKVILNLSNKVPVPRPHSGGRAIELVPTSIIDVDVIRPLPESNEPAMVMGMLEEMHATEKHVFFSLLTETFLNTLNPEY
jgi:uncharacterized protein (TIGR04255 family)